MSADATNAALSALVTRIDLATQQICADAAHLFEAAGKKNAPVGVSGNSTNAPGDLRRSIIVDGPHALGVHVYTAQVGPTTIYGRQRELGGDIYPVRARSLAFTKFGNFVLTGHVYQKPEPYMLPAYVEVLPTLPAVAKTRLAAAIQGI